MPLRPTRQDLDRLACRKQPVGFVAGQPRNAGVEAAGKAALAGRHDQKVHLVAAGAAEQRRRVRAALIGGAERASTRVHALGIGPRGDRGVLRPAQLRRRHQLHRLGDLLGRFDRGDPVLEVFKRGHAASGSLGSGASIRLNVAANASTAALSRPRSSSLSAFCVAMSLSTSACLPRSADEQAALELADPVDRQLVEIAVHAGKDHRHFFRRRQRRELRLLQQFGEARAAVEQALRRRIEIRAELRERRHLAILASSPLIGPATCFIALIWALPTHARHRDADVHRRADALEEEVGLEEDLAVGDRNHVGRDIGRHVVGLRLDDGERGERAEPVVFVELGGALEQARVEIEHVARIGFAARRPAQQQRHLAIGHGLLGQIVVADQGVHAVVAEIFADGAAGEGREELHRRRRPRRSRRRRSSIRARRCLRAP